MKFRTTLWVTTGVCLLLAGLAVAAVQAQSGAQLIVNGRVIHTDPGIVVVNGISYGPLRAVAESVGVKVEWHADQQMAVLCREPRCAMVRASEGIMRQNHLLIPIRLLAEKMGGTVTWVDSPPQVRIDIR
jgi:hypothetical protein